MQQAVIVDRIIKEFDTGENFIRVLHNINIEIYTGGLTMLVGPSGCGKTTLLSCISGILSVTSGEIDIFNHRLSNMNDKEKVLFRREKIGFIFQQYNLLPALTAAENAAIPLIAAGVSHLKATFLAKKTLEQIGMQEHVEKLPRQLSGGQQQRVAIARALIHNPKLIICDEPTAALDAKSGQAIMKILRDIANDKNRTVLIVTHDNRTYHFADRILEMSDGQIIGDHTADAFIHKEKLL